LLTALILTLALGWSYPAGAQNGGPTDPPPSPLPADTFVVPGGAHQDVFPQEAGKRLDDAHRQLWSSLTPAEREALYKQFLDAVGPTLQLASDYELQRQPSGPVVDPLQLTSGAGPFQPISDPLPPIDAGLAAGASPPSASAPAAVKTDDDNDGLQDKMERQLADNFTPAYYISRFESSGTGLSLFQDRTDTLIPTQVFPTSGPPVVVSYYRVTPLGKSGGRGYLQIDYLSLWNRDDGLPITAACGTDINLLSFFGIWSSAFAIDLPGHNLDNERSAVRVFAPLVGGAYNTDSNAYKIDRVFTAAHELTRVDRSDLQSVSPPRGPVAHPVMFASLSKHATYLFWPHGAVSLLPGWAVGAIYGGVSSACFFVSPNTCDLLYFVADEVVFDCIVEKHVPQGYVYARTDLRTNLGEVNKPLPGGKIIQVPDIRTKFQRYFAYP
jgi:hypothetical protein